MKTGILYAAKIMRKRRVARGVAAADIGMNFIITVTTHIVKAFIFKLHNIANFTFSERSWSFGSIKTS